MDFVFLGDVSLLNLGMSEEDYIFLSSEVACPPIIPQLLFVTISYLSFPSLRTYWLVACPSPP